jgi:pyruvate/2-oxoglutarate dehydrogenase complex dihydrolipoamide acyltransferase (E2) component
MAIEKSTKKIKRRFGDRADGRRVRTISPMARVSPYIMKTRNTSQNYIRDEIDTTKIDQYIKEKKAKGMAGFNLMYILIAAHVRTLSQYPGLNRFIAGQEIYARHNIEICLTIKKEMELTAPDTVIKAEFEPDATAEEVYEKINRIIEDYRAAPGGAFDGMAKILSYMPGLLMKFVVFLLQFLDYFGIMPRFISRLSPFHGSFFITSMGSLGIPPIYHHLYDFGNVPVFMSFGAKEHRYVTQPDGSVKHMPYVSFTVVMDERTVDGFYYATALRYMRRLYRNPWQMDERPETVAEDIP